MLADDNYGIARSNEYCFIETRSPLSMHLHRQHQHRQLQASLNDAAMHFSPPPSKDSINTGFTNLNAISETGRNSVSRQSLIGEFRTCGVVYFHHLLLSTSILVSLPFSALSEHFITLCRRFRHRQSSQIHI